MTVAQLDYAPGAPVRRRKLIRRGVLLVVLVGVTVLGWRYGPGAFRQARVLYYQRQCLTYEGPVDQVVYDETAVDYSKRRGYVSQAGYARPVAMYAEPALGNMAANLPGGAGSGATLFMHELRNSAGQRLLVVVQRHPVLALAPTFSFELGLEVFVYEPAEWGKPAKLLMDWRGAICQNPTEDLRFYAGQIDAKDTGHFTIRYELRGKSGVLDGRLLGAGDDVSIVIRGAGENRR